MLATTFRKQARSIRIQSHCQCGVMCYRITANSRVAAELLPSRCTLRVYEAATTELTEALDKCRRLLLARPGPRPSGGRPDRDP